MITHTINTVLQKVETMNSNNVAQFLLNQQQQMENLILLCIMFIQLFLLSLIIAQLIIMVSSPQIKHSLPPVLEAYDLEFYVLNNDIRCIHNSKTYNWGELPKWIMEIIEEDMLNNKQAINSLVARDITDPQEMMREFIIYRYGWSLFPTNLTSKRNLGQLKETF